VKCPGCEEMLLKREFEENLNVCFRDAAITVVSAP
jgi:acetyl-CoA carboxylase beta subunit